MPDNEAKDITSVMEQAWNETMGEAAQELVDDFTHLGGEPPPERAPEETQGTETNPDTPPASEEPVVETQQVETQNTPATEPVQAPQHWPEADRQAFSKLSAEGQAFLLRRHKEMEADYTRKTQENAETVKLGSAVLKNIDPAINAEIKQNGITPEKFVENLIAYHKLSAQNPIEFVRAVAKSLNVDPGQAFPTVAPGGKPTPDDPIAKRLQSIENFVIGEVRTREQNVRVAAQQTIEQFAAEKSAEGAPLRPHFDKVRTVMAKLMSVDPDMDLNTAYDVAVFRDPELRADAVRGVTAPASVPSPSPVPLDLDKARRGQQAAAAAKSNIKGSGNAGPANVAKPVRMNLQQAISAAAEEVGMK